MLHVQLRRQQGFPQMEGVRLGLRSVSSGEKDALEDSNAIDLGAK